MTYLKAFVAGFVSTLVFHQGVLAILHAMGAFPRPAWSMAKTAPLGVPSVISGAFWGGLWAIVLWLVIARLAGPAYWLTAMVFGAFVLSAVALFVVMPLKGMPMAGGWNPKLIAGALILNGTWGLGVALLMRLMGRLRG